VRNVRCIKCHKWGHINTDRECTLYGQAGDLTGVEMDPLLLMHKMREEGFALKQSVLGVRQNAPGANQELVEGASDDEDERRNESLADKIDEAGDPELDFLKALTTKQKKKLLKKLERLEKKSKKSKKHDRDRSSRDRNSRDRDGKEKSKKYRKKDDERRRDRRDSSSRSDRKHKSEKSRRK